MSGMDAADLEARLAAFGAARGLFDASLLADLDNGHYFSAS